MEPLGIGKRGVRSIALSVVNGDISKTLRYGVMCGNTLLNKGRTFEKLWGMHKIKTVIQ